MTTQSLRRIVGRALRRPWASAVARAIHDSHAEYSKGPVAPAGLPEESPALEALAERDLWFYQHFIQVPRIIATFLSEVIPLKGSVILDFGCGEGLMAKGLARFTREVHGVDLGPIFKGLEERFDRMFGAENGFPPVDLRVLSKGEALPYPDGTFDGIVAWSVFEHVAEVAPVLNEIYRVLKPGGAFFLQIAPLYYSPHGGHLRKVIDEPWAHLKMSQEDLFTRLRSGPVDQVPEAARDEHFHEKTAEEFYDFLIDGFHSLNKITVRELNGHIETAGFKVRRQLTMEGDHYEIPNELLESYPQDDLVTEQVVILMTR